MWGSFESLSWSSVTSYVADVATTVQNSVTDTATSVQNTVNDALVQTTGDFNAFEVCFFFLPFCSLFILLVC
jgi:hypothetical protein